MSGNNDRGREMASTAGEPNTLARWKIAIGRVTNSVQSAIALASVP